MIIDGKLPARRPGQLWSFTTTDDVRYVVMLLRIGSILNGSDEWLCAGSCSEGPTPDGCRPVDRFAFFDDLARCYELLSLVP